MILNLAQTKNEEEEPSEASEEPSINNDSEESSDELNHKANEE